jgi:DNA end-binding protein Ku
MIDAKLKGEGIDTSEPEEPERGNVIDLMAALKKSLGQASDQKPASSAKKPAKEVKPRAAAQPAPKAPRKRAS